MVGLTAPLLTPSRTIARTNIAYYQQYTNIAVIAGLAHLDPIYFGGRGLY